MKPSRLFRVVLLWSLASSCAPARPLVAPRDDYADYRATRLGASLPARLAAALRYLERHGDGKWHAEVSEWFARTERLFYEQSKTSPEGVEAYLAALPAGPHAEEAKARLDSYRASSRAKETERLAAAAAQFERRLEAAARSREEVLSTYAGWIERLLGLGSWGRPLEQASADFAASFQGDASAARCAGRECKKPLSVLYELEVSGKPDPFVAIMDVTLRLSPSGAVEAAELSGPDLFSRLFEAHEASPVHPERADDRRAAVKWAVELTGGAAERHLPKIRCSREADLPVVLSRACDGLFLDLIRAEEPGGDDRVVIRGPTGIKGAP